MKFKKVDLGDTSEITNLMIGIQIEAVTFSLVSLTVRINSQLQRSQHTKMIVIGCHIGPSNNCYMHFLVSIVV